MVCRNSHIYFGRWHSPAVEGKLKSFELSTGEIALTPGRSDERVIRVIVPTSAIEQIEKVVFVEAFIEDTDGDSLSIKMDYIIK